MLLFVPNKVKFSVEEETMLCRLIGVTSGNEVNGFTNPFIINSFEETEWIKIFIQVILNTVWILTGDTEPADIFLSKEDKETDYINELKIPDE